MSENGKSSENDKTSRKSEGSKATGGKQSFWTTLPGIITAITGLVVAITGLITALGDEGVIGSRIGQPTPFATITPVDQDATLPAAVEKTPALSSGMPTCTDFTAFDGKANSNAVVVAYTDADFWVRYADLEDDVENIAGVTVNLFDTSAQSGQCLREWIRYLGQDRAAHWPSESVGKGRKYSEVWINSATPPRVGELATWSALPDNLLIAVTDESDNPDYFQIYLCGEDIPADDLDRVIYFHAGTNDEALQGYAELYGSNGFTQRATVSCGG
jgi:hypothetical protein